MTGKMAIVGDGDSIMVFKAAGVATFPVPLDDDKKVKDTLRKVAKEYQIIFLTEQLAQSLGDFLKRFNEQPYPVVLVVPSQNGTTGYGTQTLKNAMERALGVDILFRED